MEMVTFNPCDRLERPRPKQPTPRGLGADQLKELLACIPATRYPLVVLLHGFGANMQDLASLAPYIDEKGYVYAFPNAPFTVELGPGYTGYSWATGRPGMAPADPNAPDVDELLEVFMSCLLYTSDAADE